VNSGDEHAEGPILTVDGLTTSFRMANGWQPAVSDLSFHIKARETLAIVGESGSGKSVTALSVMRLLPKANSRAEGKIQLEGKDILQLSEGEMRRVRGNAISMIFQEPMTSLNPVLTVGYQIAESLVYHRGYSRAAAQAETHRLLERVRIPGATRRAGEYPHVLSGGMRQRVMIAMALACQPKLLIADEPSTALDVTIQAEIIELLKAIQDEEGMAIAFITHDMAVVAEIADRVIVMLKGRKVEDGTVGQLFAEPRAAYSRSLLAAVPRLGSMRGHPDPMPFEIVDDTSGESVAPRYFHSGVAPTPVVLDVRNLTTRFDIRGGMFGAVSGRIHAVENISFSVRRGETLALVGESGCGKSTTGRAILRLVEPTAGQVIFEGRDMRMLNRIDLRRARRKMQMIFQDPFASLNPRKTAGAAILEPILVHGLTDAVTARQKVIDLLKRVDLPSDGANRFPHEFSGGQRQRICIARALALSPTLVVADEAVSALDVSIKAQIINLMMELQSEMGLAYLFISHDIAVVERMSHRVAVMYLGEIVEIGPRAAVIENPQHPYTQRLMAAVPVPEPTRRAQRRGLTVTELPSSVRTLDYVPPQRHYREVSSDHFVQEFEQTK
jgi:peptide/nickel transport system ATP-binding protein